MKKIIIFAFGLVLLLCLSSSAQQAYQSGSWHIDGQIYYSKYTGSEYADIDQAQAKILMGKSIFSGFFVGASLNIDYQKYNRSKDSMWLLGPFFKYYFIHKNSDKFEGVSISPFFQLGVSAGRKDSYSAASLESVIGFNTLLNQSIGIEIGVKGSLDYFQGDRGGGTGGGRIIAGAGLSVFL